MSILQDSAYLVLLFITISKLLFFFFYHFTVNRGRAVSYSLKIVILNGNMSGMCVPLASFSSGVFLCVSNLQGMNSVSMWSTGINPVVTKVTEAY